MTFQRLGLVVLGSLALAVAACPQPLDNRIGDGEGGEGGDNEGGSGGGGGRSGGSGGSSSGGSGGTRTGGSGGSSSGGSGGSSSGGSGGGSMADAAPRDSASGDTSSGTSTDSGARDGAASDGGGGTVSFMKDLAPIFKSKCVNNTCHNMEFNATTSAYNRLMGTAGGMCDGMKRVTTGKGSESLVVLKVEGKQMCGGKMPPSTSGKPSWTADEITKLKAWIDDGAKNN